MRHGHEGEVGTVVHTDFGQEVGDVNYGCVLMDLLGY